MDKLQLIDAIRSNPEVAALAAEWRSNPCRESAVALLERFKAELFLLCGRNLGDPLFDPRTNLHLDPLLCEIWNSLRDVEAHGLKNADDFLLSLLT
jgi:hypothetical protein